MLLCVLIPNENNDYYSSLNDLTGLSKININTAMWQELDLLPGMGEKKARAIVKFRSMNGDINSLEILRESDILKQSDIDKICAKVKFTDQ